MSGNRDGQGIGLLAWEFPPRTMGVSWDAQGCAPRYGHRCAPRCAQGFCVRLLAFSRHPLLCRRTRVPRYRISTGNDQGRRVPSHREREFPSFPHDLMVGGSDLAGRSHADVSHLTYRSTCLRGREVRRIGKKDRGSPEDRRRRTGPLPHTGSAGVLVAAALPFALRASGIPSESRGEPPAPHPSRETGTGELAALRRAARWLTASRCSSGRMATSSGSANSIRSSIASCRGLYGASAGLDPVALQMGRKGPRWDMVSVSGG